MKYYLLVYQDNWADEFDIPALACMDEEEFEKWKETPLWDPWPYNEEESDIVLYTYMGNFEEGQMFEDYEAKYAKELIDKDIKVYVVDKSFYETFHKAKLNDLSLCNIFDIH